MAVYVDSMRGCLPNGQWKWKKNCHMIADTLDELHKFARLIGLKREWFQDKLVPHYDLTDKKRIVAVLKGAKEIDDHEFCAFADLWRSVRKVGYDGPKDAITHLPPLTEK